MQTELHGVPSGSEFALQFYFEKPWNPLPVRAFEADCSELERLAMTLGTILLIVLILLLVGAVPSWPYSRGWGYGPSGILGLVLVVVLILLLMGRL